MYCIYCGKKIEDNSKHCIYCGKQQKNNSAPQKKSSSKKAGRTVLCIAVLLLSIGVTLIAGYLFKQRNYAYYQCADKIPLEIDEHIWGMSLGKFKKYSRIIMEFNDGTNEYQQYDFMEYADTEDITTYQISGMILDGNDGVCIVLRNLSWINDTLGTHIDLTKDAEKFLNKRGDFVGPVKSGYDEDFRYEVWELKKSYAVFMKEEKYLIYISKKWLEGESHTEYCDNYKKDFRNLIYGRMKYT